MSLPNRERARAETLSASWMASEESAKVGGGSGGSDGEVGSELSMGQVIEGDVLGPLTPSAAL